MSNPRYTFSRTLVFSVSVVCLLGCRPSPPTQALATAEPTPTTINALPVVAASPTQTSAIATAASTQIGKTLSYDPAYVGLSYPGGDIPISKGVCTDVVIRALRDAHQLDLQKLVHEDMKAAFSKYPANWGLKRPDKNIDHRRVPNLQRYFERQNFSLPITRKKEDYLPGDIVTCTVGRNLAHIMVVSNTQSANGTRLVIHNIGSGTKEEPHLFTFPITGHYRLPPPQ